MATYRCNKCDTFKDGDYCVCSQDPRPGQSLELVCEDCMCELEYEKEARDYEISQRHAEWCRQKGFTQ